MKIEIPDDLLNLIVSNKGGFYGDSSRIAVKIRQLVQDEIENRNRKHCTCCGVAFDVGGGCGHCKPGKPSGPPPGISVPSLIAPRLGNTYDTLMRAAIGWAFYDRLADQYADELNALDGPCEGANGESDVQIARAIQARTTTTTLYQHATARESAGSDELHKAARVLLAEVGI